MSITSDQVVNLIGRITYKPDWSFHANDSYSYEGVRVTIHWAQRETDPYNAPDYEAKAATMDATLLIRTEDHTSEVSVLRAILERCIKFELDQLVHEAREFFRVKPDMIWAAPFHPHHKGRQDEEINGILFMGRGDVNWKETSFLQLPETRELPEASQA